MKKGNNDKNQGPSHNFQQENQPGLNLGWDKDRENGNNNQNQQSSNNTSANQQGPSHNFNPDNKPGQNLGWDKDNNNGNRPGSGHNQNNQQGPSHNFNPDNKPGQNLGWNNQNNNNYIPPPNPNPQPVPVPNPVPQNNDATFPRPNPTPAPNNNNNNVPVPRPMPNPVPQNNDATFPRPNPNPAPNNNNNNVPVPRPMPNPVPTYPHPQPGQNPNISNQNIPNRPMPGPTYPNPQPGYNPNLNQNFVPEFHHQNLNAANVVPNPIKKDSGQFHCHLLENTNQTPNAKKTPNVSVSFGTLGSFTYNNPKLIPTPAQTLSPPQPPVGTKDIPFTRFISAEECKRDLMAWAKTLCCKDKKPANQGQIKEVIPYTALEYLLETFTETRYLVCTFSTCRPGESFNKLGSGPFPDPWSFACSPTKNFVTENKHINYPNTDVLQPCHGCNAYGEQRCSKCDGKGRVTCIFCKGSRMLNGQQPCGSCQAQGSTNCIRCNSAGKMVCSDCNGTQLVKWFLQVRVSYVNHKDPYVQERTELPDELISKVSGEKVFQDEGMQIVPINDSQHQDINDNSYRLIQKAYQAYAQEKRILQRHTLESITCAECILIYNEQNFKFWVIGNEKLVHFPNYPGRCGCGCCCTIV